MTTAGLAAILFSSILTADWSPQRTWIVDAAASPGHDFVDLPPALAAAQHGDRLFVLPGAYRGTVTDRGVAIACAGATLTTPLRITGLPLGQRFALVGLASDPGSSSTGGIECVDNAGVVVLDRVDFRGPRTWLWQTAPACQIERCDAVVVTQSRFTGSPGARIVGSRVSFVSCHLVGADGYLFGGVAAVAGQAALTGEFATIDLVHCKAKGGAGATYTQYVAEPGVALSARESDLRLSGAAPDGLEAGAAAAGRGAAALRVDGGVLRLDPTLRLTGSGGMPGIVGQSQQRILRRLPALRGTPAPTGGIWTTELYAPTGWLDVLCLDAAVGLRNAATGTLWLDPTRLLVVAAGTVDASERRRVHLRVPAQTALLGRPLFMQSLTLDVTRAALEYSNVFAGLVW
jgi:hypothetical protein